VIEWLCYRAVDLLHLLRKGLRVVDLPDDSADLPIWLYVHWLLAVADWRRTRARFPEYTFRQAQMYVCPASVDGLQEWMVWA
jgi:hypothetical protein